jgi:hypothetical protein
LYPQALGFLFVTFYDSQGHGGGILTCLHTGKGVTTQGEIKSRNLLIRALRIHNVASFFTYIDVQKPSYKIGMQRGYILYIYILAANYGFSTFFDTFNIGSASYIPLFVLIGSDLQCSELYFSCHFVSESPRDKII